MGEANEDYRYKVILLGNIDVGKTSIIVRFADGTYNDGFKGEIDQKSKNLTIDGSIVKVILTDTAGQERFRTLTSSYYRNSDAMILVFDITNESSFDDLEDHFTEGNRFSARSLKFLVGNKSDLEDRQISFESAQEAAKKFGVEYIETSAKNGDNIEKLFEKISRTLMEAGAQKNRVATVQLGGESSGKKKKNSVCIL